MLSSKKKFSLAFLLIAIAVVSIGSVYAAASTKPSVSGFTASPESLSYPGGNVTLSASVKNATRCIFTVKPVITGVSKTVACANGKETYKTVLPKNASTKNTTYAFKLVVTGNQGMGTVAAPVRDVIVRAAPAPVIKSFTSSNHSLTNTGGLISLNATVDNAVGCSLAVTPAITGLAATVPCSSNGGSIDSVAMPNNTSSSNISYTFTLTANGISSSTSSSIVVVVSSTSTPPPTPPIAGNTISVPAEPDAFVIAGNNIWVASCSGNSVTAINNTTKQVVVGPITGPSYAFNCPDALAFNGTNIWVANKLGNSITVLNATTGSFVQTLTGSQILNPNALAFDGTNIWVSDDSQNGDVGSFISEFNATTGIEVRAITTPKNYKYIIGDPSCLALTGSGIWVSDLINSRALEFNINNGTYLRQTSGGPATSSLSCVTYHSGYIWASGLSADVIVEYNANTGVYVRKITGIVSPAQLIFTGNDLFAVSESSTADTVREYNSAGVLLKTVATESNKGFGTGISAISADGNNLWTANYSSNSVTRYTI